MSYNTVQDQRRYQHAVAVNYLHIQREKPIQIVIIDEQTNDSSLAYIVLSPFSPNCLQEVWEDVAKAGSPPKTYAMTSATFYTLPHG